MTIDRVAAEELELYINNDGQLYRQSTLPIIKNLRNKMAAGKFKKALGAKAFLYLVDAGAKKYSKEFGGTWYVSFPPDTRRAVAKDMVDDFYEQAKAGEFDDLLFKKYQGVKNPDTGRGHQVAFHSTRGRRHPYEVVVVTEFRGEESREVFGYVSRTPKNSEQRWYAVDLNNHQGPFFDTRAEAANWLIYDNR